MEKKKITEDQHPETEWYAEAKKQTVETLPGFVKHLTEDYDHDYGTVCHAVTAAALGAAHAADTSPQGGITGFQAGCIMWSFIRQWMYGDNECGLRIINYDNMLYPQHERNFTDKVLKKRQWAALREQAEKRIMEDRGGACPEVLNHWLSIRDGKVPFGYTVEEEEERS